MAINYKFDLFLVSSYVVSQCSTFWLGEGFLAWPEIAAKLGLVLTICFLPIDTIVSVKINSRVLISTLGVVGWITILSLV